MIPYPDLVAALERWRMRNGLPVGGGGVSAAAPVAAPAAYVPMTTPSSFGPPPRPAPASVSAPMPAVKAPTRPQTDEPLDLGDADVLDEDLLGNEGNDFAMSFGAGGAKPEPHTMDDDVPEEKTAIGLPGEPHTSPFPTEPGVDTFDADDDFDDLDAPDPKPLP